MGQNIKSPMIARMNTGLELNKIISRKKKPKLIFQSIVLAQLSSHIFKF